MDLLLIDKLKIHFHQLCFSETLMTNPFCSREPCNFKK